MLPCDTVLRQMLRAFELFDTQDIVLRDAKPEKILYIEAGTGIPPNPMTLGVRNEVSKSVTNGTCTPDVHGAGDCSQPPRSKHTKLKSGHWILPYHGP